MVSELVDKGCGAKLCVRNNPKPACALSYKYRLMNVYRDSLGRIAVVKFSPRILCLRSRIEQVFHVVLEVRCSF